MNDEFLLSSETIFRRKRLLGNIYLPIFWWFSNSREYRYFCNCITDAPSKYADSEYYFLDLFCFICFCNEQIMGISFQVT